MIAASGSNVKVYTYVTDATASSTADDTAWVATSTSTTIVVRWEEVYTDLRRAEEAVAAIAPKEPPKDTRESRVIWERPNWRPASAYRAERESPRQAVSSFG